MAKVGREKSGAPLGIEPDRSDDLRATLVGALEQDGVRRSGLDIRLHGSAATVFSGAHKRLPASDDPRLTESGRALLNSVWPGTTPRPDGIPFDLAHRIGIDGPSDYNINISSGSMSDLAVERFGHMEHSSDFRNGHGYITDHVLARYIGVSFPHLAAWQHYWSDELGRPMTVRAFEASGPFNTERMGRSFSEHFRDTDWMIFY